MIAFFFGIGIISRLAKHRNIEFICERIYIFVLNSFHLFTVKTGTFQSGIMAYGFGDDRKICPRARSNLSWTTAGSSYQCSTEYSQIGWKWHNWPTFVALTKSHQQTRNKSLFLALIVQTQFLFDFKYSRVVSGRRGSEFDISSSTIYQSQSRIFWFNCTVQSESKSIESK